MVVIIEVVVTVVVFIVVTVIVVVVTEVVVIVGAVEATAMVIICSCGFYTRGCGDPLQL